MTRPLKNYNILELVSPFFMYPISVVYHLFIVFLKDKFITLCGNSTYFLTYCSKCVI